MPDWGHMVDWSYWGWGGMMLGGLGMLLFWALVIALVVLAVRGLGASGTASQPPSRTTRSEQRTPLEIVQARYAHGEISREEYETIRRDLQGT